MKYKSQESYPQKSEILRFKMENYCLTKISGDGARMTRLTNYVILSCCNLTETEDTLSAKGNIALASNELP